MGGFDRFDLRFSNIFLGALNGDHHLNLLSVKAGQCDLPHTFNAMGTQFIFYISYGSGSHSSPCHEDPPTDSLFTSVNIKHQPSTPYTWLIARQVNESELSILNIGAKEHDLKFTIISNHCSQKCLKFLIEHVCLNTTDGIGRN